MDSLEVKNVLIIVTIEFIWGTISWGTISCPLSEVINSPVVCLLPEVTIRPAGLYTNLYNTYVEGLGQVPGKKYRIFRTSCRMNSHCFFYLECPLSNYSRLFFP